jgi:hypothetical protein
MVMDILLFKIAGALTHVDYDCGSRHMLMFHLAILTCRSNAILLCDPRGSRAVAMELNIAYGLS